MNQIAEKTPYKIYIYKREIATTQCDMANIEKGQYYRERRIAEIGCNDYHSPISARKPKFTMNINGKNTLTFDLHYKYYDEYDSEYKINPFIDMIKNETFLKLKLGDNWYDLIVNKISKNTDNSVYSITASDLYITELGKNGFNVELATELENNMGTIQEIGEYALQNSDWKVAPKYDDASSLLKENKIYSDTIIQTITEPLYQGVLKNNITIKALTEYRPDRLKDDTKNLTTISSGETIYFFYSDLLNKRKNITILYRKDKEYKVSGLDQVVQNSYNYQILGVNYIESIDKNNLPKPTFIKDTPMLACENDNFTKWRGERVVQSTKTGYNFKLHKPVTYYSKTGSDQTFFGYTETDYISPTLTKNFLSNTHNSVSLKDDWYKESGDYSINVMPNIYGECATVINVEDNTKLCNYGPQGNRKNIETLHPGDKFILAFLYKTENYTENAKQVYDYTNEYIDGFTSNHTPDGLSDAQFPTENADINQDVSVYNGVKFSMAFCSIPPRTQSLQTYDDPEFKNSEGKKIINETTFNSNKTFSITDTVGRVRHFVYQEVQVKNDFQTITDLTENLVNPLCAIFTFPSKKSIYDIWFFRKKRIFIFESSFSNRNCKWKID